MIVTKLMLLGYKYVLSPTYSYFNPRLAARAKVTLSRAQNIFNARERTLQSTEMFTGIIP